MFPRLLAALTAAAIASCACAMTYHVDDDGSDENPGTAAAPFRSVQRAADAVAPGDTVLVYDGTYTNDLIHGEVLRIGTSGLPHAWITFKAAPGSQPVISAPGWAGIQVEPGANYIHIEGFKVVGDARAVNPGSGIVAGRTNRGSVHHVTIRGNRVSDLGGGGISGIHTDYLTIEDNTVTDTSWGVIASGPDAGKSFGNSGISVWLPEQLDEAPGYHHVIRRNVSAGNHNTAPFVGSSQGLITDGNGIILDGFRHRNGGDGYEARTLVENNVVFSNGGRGIHIYESDRADLLHNTIVGNNLTDDISHEGGLSLVNAADVNVLNNLVVAAMDGVPKGGPGAGQNLGDTSSHWRGNLLIGQTYFGTQPLTFADNDVWDFMPDNLDFIKPDVDPDKADFRLMLTSLAVDAGIADAGVNEDFDGASRPRGRGFDAGAFEAVPEPGILTMLGIAGATIGRRR